MKHDRFYISIIATCWTLVICASSPVSFKFGLENVTPQVITKHNLATQPIGLITNQTGKDQTGTPTLDVLRKQGINITTIFVPEHGYTGTAPAGKSVENSVESQTNIPIVSLYSHHNGLVGRTINHEKLDTVSTLIFDMQDSGMRHYTYISTLMRCLEAAATHKKKIFVLDRPNPLGYNMDGPLVGNDLISFISIAPIPLRHGMTIGELALYFNEQILTHKADLHVIPMKGYMRHTPIPLRTPLSPNLLTSQACYGYSFLGLLGEIRPFDVGVGTPYAFQCIMLPTTLSLPDILWKKVEGLLKKQEVQASRYRVFSERKKVDLEGLRIQVGDINRVHSFNLFLDLISLFRDYGVALSCSSTFDKAIGTPTIRTALSAELPLTNFYTAFNPDLKTFHTKARPLFLYQPHPHITQ